MALGVWGGAQEQAPRAGPKAAGRLGKHQPTQPEAEGAGVGIRKLQHVGVASVESRAGPHVCGHPQGQSEKRGGQELLRQFTWGWLYGCASAQTPGKLLVQKVTGKRQQQEVDF